jgi:hypothetical protein
VAADAGGVERGVSENGIRLASMEPRDAAVALARGRIALGVAAILTPGVAGRFLIGSDGSRGGAKLFARMVGVRDVALGLGAVIALDRGAPVRGWLEASALADGGDAAACLLGREHMPSGAFAGTVGLASVAAGVGMWLARELDPPPEAEPGHPEAVATGHPPERVAARQEAEGSS